MMTDRRSLLSSVVIGMVVAGCGGGASRAPAPPILPVAKVNVLEQDVPTPDQPNPDDSRSWTEATPEEPRSGGSALGQPA